MEAKDTMEIEKKVYNTPKLVEHGDFIEMTQSDTGLGWDGESGSRPAQAPIPF